MGAFASPSGQILATHAGIRPAMRQLLLDGEPFAASPAAATTAQVGPDGGAAEQAEDQISGDTPAESKPAEATPAETKPAEATVIAAVVGELLDEAVSECEVGSFPARRGPKRARKGRGTSFVGATRCRFSHPVFESGPERGGKGIGGPFWTDFGALANEPVPISDAVQIVGHSAAPCDVADSLEQCQPIRPSADASTIDVDVAMFWGNRAFLEFTSHGNSSSEFRSHVFLPDRGDWTSTLTFGSACEATS